MGKYGQSKKGKVNKKHELYTKNASQDRVKKNEIRKKKHTYSPLHTIKTTAPAESTGASKLSTLQQKFQKKLEGARFRVINEKLYTCRGSDAFHEFQQNSGLFDIYHEGFREQVTHWPLNPLDVIIDWIKRKHKNAIIADMGCGDARLSETVPNKTYSFDLVSKNPRVTACDIAHVPLENESVDIVVFCLALMGTNIGDFLKESFRILKPSGRIKIAEVRSRFEGAEGGIEKFLKVLKKAGFDIVNRDSNNTMFFLLEGVKTTRECIVDDNFSIQPCLYKRR